MPVTIIIVILLLHAVAGCTQVAFGGEVPGCDGHRDPFCGTPIQGFNTLGQVNVIEQEQGGLRRALGWFPGIQGFDLIKKVVTDAWGVLKGAFLMQYDWLDSALMIPRIIMFLVQAILGGIVIKTMIEFATTILRR